MGLFVSFRLDRGSTFCVSLIFSLGLIEGKKERDSGETHLEETLATVVSISFEVDAFTVTVGEGRISTLAIATCLRGIRESTFSPAFDAVSVRVSLEGTFPMCECAPWIESVACVDVTGPEGAIAAFECGGAGIWMRD